MSLEVKAEPINLVRGSPNPCLLPVQLIKDAVQAALSVPSIAKDGFLYGPDPGYEPLREAMAHWLGEFYAPKRDVSPERICITGGASQNLGCLLNVYTDPEFTRNIWIVAPAYFLAFRIFEDAGFAKRMRAVPEDGEGIDLAFLRAEIKKSEDDARSKGNSKPRYKPERERAKVYKHIIYCVPTFANPTSRTMSLRRRKELVQIAREYDALVVSDDVYDFLQWPADIGRDDSFEVMRVAHLPRLVDIDSGLDGGAEREDADGFGNACSNGSFSKIAGPGLRVGWVEGTKKLAYGISQTGTTRSGGAPSQLTSTYVAHLVKTGAIQHHIKDVLQPAYATRYALLMTAVKADLLPLGFTLPQSDRKVVGGYFVWLGLPAGVGAEALTERCTDAEHVMIAPGHMFEVPGDNSTIRFPSSIRLCFASEGRSRLGEGVRRVAKAAKSLLNEQYVVVDRSDADEQACSQARV